MAGVYQISLISSDEIISQNRVTDQRAILNNMSGSTFVNSTNELTSYLTNISAISASILVTQADLMGIDNAQFVNNLDSFVMQIPQTVFGEYDNWQSIGGSINNFMISSSYEPSQIENWNLSYGFMGYVIAKENQSSEDYLIPINDSLQAPTYFSASCLTSVESLQKPILPPSPSPVVISTEIKSRDVSRFQKTYLSVRNLPVRVRMFR